MDPIDDLQDRAPLSVLLIEDDDGIAEITQVLLKRVRVDCARAATLAEARALLACADGQMQFDAVIADHRLPDGSGGEVVRAHPDLPAVVLTAYDAQDYLEREPPLPRRAVLRTKPQGPEALRAALEEARAR